MRLIFSKPIELDRDAKLFMIKVNQYNGVLCDKLLASFLSTLFREVNERDIRKIAERLNKRKYLGYTDTTKYHKIKGKYHKILKDTQKADTVLNTIKFNAIAGLQTYKIYLEDFGKSQDNDNTTQISMINQLLDNYESEGE